MVQNKCPSMNEKRSYNFDKNTTIILEKHNQNAAHKLVWPCNALICVNCEYNMHLNQKFEKTYEGIYWVTPLRGGGGVTNSSLHTAEGTYRSPLILFREARYEPYLSNKKKQRSFRHLTAKIQPLIGGDLAILLISKKSLTISLPNPYQFGKEIVREFLRY